jgi:hypothetical protein
VGMFRPVRRDRSLHIWFRLDQGKLRVMWVMLMTPDKSREVVVLGGQISFRVQHIRKVHYLPSSAKVVRTNQLFRS